MNIRGYMAEDLTPVFVFNDSPRREANEFFRRNTPERESLTPSKPNYPAKHNSRSYLESHVTEIRDGYDYVSDGKGGFVRDEEGRMLRRACQLEVKHCMRLRINKRGVNLGSFRKKYVDPETEEPTYGEGHEFAIDWSNAACNDNIIL